MREQLQWTGHKAEVRYSLRRKYRDTLPSDTYMWGILQKSDMYTVATFKGVCSF